MPEYTMSHARTHLSKLVAAAEAGETIIIKRRNRPVAGLTALRRKPFPLGALKGLVGEMPPDFDAPMSEENLALWEGRGEEDDQ